LDNTQGCSKAVATTVLHIVIHWPVCHQPSACVSILKHCERWLSLSQPVLAGLRQFVGRSSTARLGSATGRRLPLRSRRLRRTKRIGARCLRLQISWRACVLRGDVHEFRPPRGTGHEQRGRRYGVIVQANELLPRSVILVAPTSHSARPASFRPEIELLGETTRVLVEQVGALDSGRLGELVGRVSPEQQWGIDEALTTVLGLR
jgi:mRNA interferase MazF